MSVTWTIELLAPRDAAPVFETAVSKFAEAVAAFEVPDRPDTWQVLGYAPAAPDHAALTAAVLVAAAAAGIRPPDVRVLPLAPRDWLAENQRSFQPVRAGRYFIHSEGWADAAAARVPAASIAICLNAGPAFGTGTHETTRGCLQALDRIARHGRRPRRVLDVGTGSGILAIAAALTWPGPAGRPQIFATDIDPVAVATAAGNAARNRVAPGIRLARADGLRGLPWQVAGYELVFANILAGPLVAMAGALSAAVAPGGDLVLSGLLQHQANRVHAAYRARGLKPLAPIPDGEWMTLCFRKPAMVAGQDPANLEPTGVVP